MDIVINIMEVERNFINYTWKALFKKGLFRSMKLTKTELAMNPFYN